MHPLCQSQMSPKSKTQKRNQQKRNALKEHKGGENHSNKQQQELHRMSAENRDMKTRLAQLETMKTMFMKMTPGSPGYDPNWKPPSAASDPKIDEKYVKVPSAVDTALAQAYEAISHLPATAATLPQINKAVQAIAAAKEVNAKVDEKGGVKCPHHLVHVFSKALKLPLKQSPSEIEYTKEAIRAGMKGRPLSISLSVMWNADASSAATARSFVQRLRPSDASEFTYLTNLFDEYKMIKATNHFAWSRDGGTAADWPLWGMAYDPQISGAYTSVEQTIIADQKIGPGHINVVGADALPVTNTGMYHFHIKVPEGPQYEYGAVTGIGTGTWTDVTITAVDYGYFKSYRLSGGAGVVTYCKSITVMEVLFRCRT